MNLHKSTGDSLEPCKHMESMLNRTAEGSAPPLMRWYATSHAKGCDRCGSFLERVTGLLSGLKQIKSQTAQPVEPERLSTDRWESIEAGWAEAESR